MREILEACRRLDREGRPAVLATVVRVAGSTYRKPGARMLFPKAGDPVGMVSGGCLEADLAERARAVLESGEPQTVVYDMRSPDDIVWGLGLGCNGEVRVLLEPLPPGEHPAYLEFLRRCLEERRAGAVATVFVAEGETGARVADRITVEAADAGPGTGLGQKLTADALRALGDRRSAVREYGLPGGRVEALIEYVAQPVSLVVFGAGSDAQPIVRIAAELGWQVTVADDRPAFARPELFPRAAEVVQIAYDRLAKDAPPIDAATPVLVMTHHFLHDLELLRFLLNTNAPYVGFLGPRRRMENLLAELAKRDVIPSEEGLKRLHGPVGIDIGGETPEEIALSAIAEIRAVISGRPAGFLRDRKAPLHEWP